MKKSVACAICGKKPLKKDEIALYKKLIDAQAKKFYCLECLADWLEVSEDDLKAKIEQFKEEGCTLF